ncbi:MAG: PAS domain S-box protein [Sumerlaeia bacterium]
MNPPPSSVYETIFHQTYQFIGLLKPDGTVSTVNKTALDAAGVTLAEVVGMPFWETPWWRSCAEARATLREAIRHAAAGKCLTYETENAGQDGKPFSVNFSIKPLYDHDGRIEWLLVEGNDIRELAESRQLLAEREELLNQFVRHVPAPISIFSLDGECLASSQHWIDYLTRHLPRANLDANLSRFPEDFLFSWSELRQVLTGRPIASGTRTLPSRVSDDGIHAAWIATQFHQDNGPNYIVVALNDISQLTEEALRSKTSELKLRTVFETVSAVILVLDMEGRILDLNPAAEALYEVSREDAIGLNYMDHFVSREVRQRIEAANFPKLQAGQRIESFENPIVTRSGQEREMIWNITPINFAGPGPAELYCFGLDITHLKEIQEKLELQTATLEQSNRDLQQFAYIASHDLQEPLRMVASYLQLIEKRYAERLGPDGLEFLAFAVDGAKRMKTLIQALLDYSRIESQGQPFQPVALDECVDAALRHLGPRIEESGARIDRQPLPTISGDPSQMTQVFQNLLSNSLKFQPSGQQPRISIWSKQAEGIAELEFHDNGIGIPQPHRERIFQIFQRLHGRDQFPGTGIGLAVCKRVIERHNGTIRVEPSDRPGTTFRLTFPRKDP